MVITNGRLYHPLKRLWQGERATWFEASRSPVTERKKWIAGQLETKGSIKIDEGAISALNNGKSLLSVGVVEVTGEFERGDTIVIFNQSGEEVGRGLAGYDSVDAKQIVGLNSQEIMDRLGMASRSELVHRDDLVLR